MLIKFFKGKRISNFVTKIRWVIEAINGQFKTQFRYLDHNISNPDLKHIQLDFKIEAMLINRFNKRLFSDENNSIDIAKSIQDKLLF